MESKLMKGLCLLGLVLAMACGDAQAPPQEPYNNENNANENNANENNANENNANENNANNVNENNENNSEPVVEEAPSLVGQWSTPNCVAAPQADGSTAYLTLDFEFTESQWDLDYSVYGNDDCSFKLFTVAIVGPYEITGPSSVGDDIWDGRFGFSDKTLTAHAEPILGMLNGMDCGPGGWEVGVTQSIFDEGCPGLGQYPSSVCSADYDILKVEGNTLLFGARPGDNNMCEPAKRPTELSGLGFTKG